MQLINKNIDIHCKVVDNYGDAGIALRLARSYQKVFPYAEVRIFIDDLKVLSLLEPRVSTQQEKQFIDSIIVINTQEIDIKDISSAPLVIQLLETPLPEGYEQKAFEQSQLILNIEGVSAESWVEKVHGSYSLVDGKAKRLFFIPGFTEESGGLLFDKSEGESKKNINDFLNVYGFSYSVGALVGVLFNYGDDLSLMLTSLNRLAKDTFLFVCGEKSQKAVKQINLEEGRLNLIFPDFFSQSDFDALLSCTDFNFIRGEDSLMQAINIQAPFLWQIYPQSDSAHLVKLNAFLYMLESYSQNKSLFENYKQLTYYYNGVSLLKESEIELIIYSFIENLDKIRAINQKLRKNLLEQGTLIERLIKFIEEI